LYSPKINEDFIPSLYRIAKVKKMPMTKLVNSVIDSFLRLPTTQTMEEQYQTGGSTDGNAATGNSLF
jgi:hypothetical protein